ncbi:unnamed protein product [Urochloa decumbens]|uniref:PDZ domain-containing protein n=1 Tax=Urochloa decumbens TaxID=240449 RepID=A0ABC9HCQ2_9POAL
MPRKNQDYGNIGGEKGSMSKKQKTLVQSNFNPKDSLPVVDDLTRELRSFFLPRGYPMPPGLAVGLHLVNKFEDRFDNLDGYMEEHAKLKLVASRMSQSVVSLASFKGKERFFVCTGTIVRHMPSKMTILTSASLVGGHGDEAKIVNQLKIKVRLPGGKLVEGKLWKYDFHYNIAVVNTKSFPELHASHIPCEVQLNFESPQTNLVAIGRCFESGELMATSGTLLYKSSRLDCQELLMSTCKITKAGIGGPLVSSGGNFVGMNFYAENETPFLPVNMLWKCFKHFETFGRVVRPWFGLRVGSLWAEKLSICEEIHNSFPNARGVYVEMVSDGSPAAACGIKVGDIISKLDGVALSNAQEFHELIWYKTESAVGFAEGMKVCVLRPSDVCEFYVTLNAEVVDINKSNSRWPVPKPEWIYPSTNNDDSDFTFVQDIPKSYREEPLSDLYAKQPSGYVPYYSEDTRSFLNRKSSASGSYFSVE